MARTLKLSIGPGKEAPLELAVTRTEKLGDERASKTTIVKVKDDWDTGGALADAAASAIAEYLRQYREDMREEIDESPIGKAARG